MKSPFILFPFDHRGSLGKDILALPYPPPSARERAVFLATKELLYEAFLVVRGQWPQLPLGVLVDQEFGSDIHTRAAAAGIPHYLTLEQSGGPLRLEAAETLHTALRTLQPTGGKVLVRYTVGDERHNAPARQTLRHAAALCAQKNIPLLLEVLADGPHATHDENVLAAVAELSASVRPAYWKLEGLDDVRSWERFAEGNYGPAIVLGRGEGRGRVEEWLRVAKRSGVVDGFAIGRTLWAEPVRAWRRGTIAREQAVQEVARTFAAFVELWMS
jgi:myo-inositol catabolism protein IolC